MKIEKWTLGLAAAGLITLSPALLAQTPPPAPAPAPAAPAAPQPVPMLTALSATTISGYVDTSAVWNPGTGNANPAPYAFNAGKQDGFNLNAVDVKISKPQDESGWSAGYTAELSWGPDAQAIDGGAYPIRQAFVALHMPAGNGIDWQLGRWDNLLGYESSDSYKNPNYTRSYGYSVEPTEHTGLLGTYKFNDEVSLQIGVADTVTTTPVGINTREGAGGVFGADSTKGYVSLLTLTAPDSWGALKGSAFYVGYDFGPGVGPSTTVLTHRYDRYEWYFGTTLNTPVKDLTFGASFDSIEHLDVASVMPVTIIDSTGAAVVQPGVTAPGPAVDSGYFGAYAAYASYKLTEKLTLNGRAEYAFGNGLSGNAMGAGSVFNKVFAATATAQYDLWANVISRLELRWDHAACGGAGSTPFGGDAATGGAPNKKNEVMIAANVIYKF